MPYVVCNKARKSYIPDSLMHKLADFGQPPQMLSGMHLHMTFESQTCGSLQA